MTTLVSHAKSSTIRAHARRGPLAKPDPEEGLSHIYSQCAPFPILSNLTVQGIEYQRRKSEFFHYAYNRNFDAPRQSSRLPQPPREPETRFRS